MQNINWKPVESLCLSPINHDDMGEYIAVTAVNEIGRRYLCKIWVQKIETPHEQRGVYYDHSCRHKVSPRQISKWLAVAPLGIEPQLDEIKPFMGSYE